MIPSKSLYNEDYYNMYVERSKTHVANKLLTARGNLVVFYRKVVRSLAEDILIDVGCGSGDFVHRYNCHGYDVNRHSVQAIGPRFIDAMEPLDIASLHISMCFWDSLEHIPNPAPILSNITDYAFVSMPIYENLADVLTSKHFKPNEHCWYFTRTGFVTFMTHYGFQLLEHNTMEQECGRESITSFVFRRKWKV